MSVTFTADQLTTLLERVRPTTPIAETPQPQADATNSHGLPAGWPDKALHEYTEAERAQHVDARLVGAMFNRSARPPLDPRDIVDAINQQAVSPR